MKIIIEKGREDGAVNNNDDQTSRGLNQIMEIINAKGDEGELKQIVGQSKKLSEEERNDEK